MEVPEKLYFGESDKGLLDIYSIKESDNEVEYIRKDAFIKKAAKFIEKINNVDEYSWYNEEEHASGITEKCIEDFKKYMKGE